MRISDWSSDVCSSDLADDVGKEFRVHMRAGGAADLVGIGLGRIPEVGAGRGDAIGAHQATAGVVGGAARHHEAVDDGQVLGVVVGEIGRASCRERVCQYV